VDDSPPLSPQWSSDHCWGEGDPVRWEESPRDGVRGERRGGGDVRERRE
jgi:hypothetical protein